MHSRTLALIPAKAASTRLPRKNMTVLEGETLVARSVRCALEAGVFDDVVVTTEDEEIAQEARRAGASVPFLRPEKLSIDPAGVADVTLHALDELEQRGSVYDTVAILLPTAPFRGAEDCRDAMAIYRRSGVSFLMSVTKYEHSPLAALILENGFLEPLHPDWINRLGAKADRPIPATVRANGAITICDVAAMRQAGTYYHYPLAAYEMPWERSVDIDTQADLALAQFLLQSGTVALDRR